MRSAIRNKKKRVDMEAVDRRAFAASIAACDFIHDNVEPSEKVAKEQAIAAVLALKQLLVLFPVKPVQKPAAATA